MPPAGGGLGKCVAAAPVSFTIDGVPGNTTWRWGATSSTLVLPVYWRGYHTLRNLEVLKLKSSVLTYDNYFTSARPGICDHGVHMDWFKVGYLLVFQLGLGCLVRHISLFCCFWGGLYGLVSCVLARAHRQPLCRSISVVNFHWVGPGCVFVRGFYIWLYIWMDFRNSIILGIFA